MRTFLDRSFMRLRRLTVTDDVRSQQMLGAGRVRFIMPTRPLSELVGLRWASYGD